MISDETKRTAPLPTSNPTGGLPPARLNQSPLRPPSSTRRMREIRDAGLAQIAKSKPAKFCIIESARVHFFSDCVMVIGRYKQGYLTVAKDEMLTKEFSVYSRDLKTWENYVNQFEPKEGFHRAFEFKPHDAPFATSEW